MLTRKALCEQDMLNAINSTETQTQENNPPTQKQTQKQTQKKK